MTGGTLADSAGTGAFQITGTVDLTGTVPVSQTVTGAGNITSTNIGLPGPGTVTVDGTLAVNSGTEGNGQISGSGSVTVASGGRFTTSGAQDTVFIQVPIIVQAGGTVSIGSASTAQNDDTADTNSGTFQVVNGGELSLSSNSALTNTASGTLGVTVNGTAGGISGPGVTITGSTLEVTTVGSPAVGTTFTPISGPVTGTFSHFDFGTGNYSVSYPSNSVVLTTEPSIPGGAITVKKVTKLVGHRVVKVSGSGWGVNSDTSVTVNECAGTHYSPQTCDAANQATATLGTGKKAGTFKNAAVTLATGIMDTNGDTCGVVGSTSCFIVVVGNTGDATDSVALGFTLPSVTAKDTTGVLGNDVDALKVAGMPGGDAVVAQECDASVTVPSTVSSHCDAATEIGGTAAASGKVVFTQAGLTLLVNGGYSDGSGGTCVVGGTCDIVVTDASNPAVDVSEAVTFATPTVTLKATANVPDNFVNKVSAGSFPVGDTVTARQCDSGVDPASTLGTRCDTATVITGTVASNGKVTFTPAGVTTKVGLDYVESGSGTCPAGGTCDIVVNDSTTSGISVEVPITLAA